MRIEEGIVEGRSSEFGPHNSSQVSSVFEILSKDLVCTVGRVEIEGDVSYWSQPGGARQLENGKC